MFDMKNKGIGCGILTVIAVAGLLVSGHNPQKRYSSLIFSDSEKVISVYENGKDVTQDYLSQQQKMMTSVSAFLNCDEKELIFSGFCRLENDGATIDVVFNKQRYTFVCDKKGRIATFSQSNSTPR